MHESFERINLSACPLPILTMAGHSDDSKALFN